MTAPSPTMSPRRSFPFVRAVLAYLLPTFAIGFVWHLVAFHAHYTQLAIYRAEPLIPFGFASMVVQALVFAWAYPRLFDTDRAVWKRSALRAGLVFAALSWSFTTLAVAAKHPMSSVADYVLIETAFTVCQFAIVAPLIALAWRGVDSAK
ncbi:MAG: hypothetical protein AB7P21_30515 [Lautropia sp.]